MNKFGHSLKKLIFSIALHRPKLSLGISLGVSLILGLGLLYLESNFSVKIWFNPDDLVIQRLDNFEKQFGGDEKLVIALHHPEGIFRPESIKVLQQLTNEMWLLPEVMRVESLANYHMTKGLADEILTTPFLEKDTSESKEKLVQKKREALDHRLLVNNFISKDASTTLLHATLRPPFEKDNHFGNITLAARKLVEKIKRDHPQITFIVTGAPAVNYALKEITETDLQKFFPLALVLISLVLLFQFRTFWGVILPLLVICLSILSCFGIAGWLSIKFDNFLSAIPGILLAIGMAETIHILSTYFRERKKGISHHQAMHKSLEANLWPTFLTCFTTFLGFATSLSSPLFLIRSFGFLAGVGTLYTWFLAIFFVVPLTLLLRVDPPLSRTHQSIDKFIRPIHLIKIHCGKIFLALTLLSVYAAWVGMKVERNSDPFLYFSERVKARQDNEFLQTKFEGLSGVEISLDSGIPDGAIAPEYLNKVEKLQEWMTAQPLVTQAFSLVDVIKEVHQGLNGGEEKFSIIPHHQQAIAQELFAYSLGLPPDQDLSNKLTIDRSGLRMSVRWSIQRTQESLAMVKLIEQQIKKFGLKGHVTGRLSLYHYIDDYVIETFVSSLFWELVMVTLIMFFAFRSFKLGILSMIPNVTPLAFGGAILVGMGQFFDLGAGIVASVVLGIAVDDTIHFLSHWSQYRRQGYSTQESLEKVFEVTGPAILWTTLILCLGFGSFIFSDFTPNMVFGVLTAGMLFVALVFDLLYLPSILFLLERWDNRKL